MGFEPTPFQTSALNWRLRPLGQLTTTNTYTYKLQHKHHTQTKHTHYTQRIHTLARLYVLTSTSEHLYKHDALQRNAPQMHDTTHQTLMRHYAVHTTPSHLPMCAPATYTHGHGNRRIKSPKQRHSICIKRCADTVLSQAKRLRTARTHKHSVHNN